MANGIERRQEAKFWREYNERFGKTQEPQPTVRDCHHCGTHNSVFLDTANYKDRCNKCWRFIRE